MSHTHTQSRLIDDHITIEAPIEAVWRALTEADEITRWFATGAKITPGVGGAIDLTWEEHFRWPMVIKVWDPPRHLRVEDQWPLNVLKDGARDHELFVDFHLERDGSGTRLRVVHSGFGGSGSWDALYDSTACGWRCEFGALKHYLERCKGQDRDLVMIMRELRCSLDDAFARLLGGGPGGGLAIDRGALVEDGRALTRARWRSAEIEPVTILRSKPGRGVVFTPVSEPRVLIFFGVEPALDPAKASTAMVRFNLYEGARSMAPALKSFWEKTLEQALG